MEKQIAQIRNKMIAMIAIIALVSAWQHEFIAEGAKYFLKQRRKLHVQQVDWYSWQDSSQSICAWCPSSVSA